MNDYVLLVDVGGSAPARSCTPWPPRRRAGAPHLAGAADDVVRHHTDMICTDLEALRSGRRPVHCANPAVLDAPHP